MPWRPFPAVWPPLTSVQTCRWPRRSSCSTKWVFARCYQACQALTSKLWYAAPGVRMGALQKLQTIYIATRDSIRTSEDGPTYQPVELAAIYRALPWPVYPVLRHRGDGRRFPGSTSSEEHAKYHLVSPSKSRAVSSVDLSRRRDYGRICFPITRRRRSNTHQCHIRDVLHSPNRRNPDREIWYRSQNRGVPMPTPLQEAGFCVSAESVAT